MRLFSSSSASPSDRLDVASMLASCDSIIWMRGLEACLWKYEPTRFFRSLALPTCRQGEGPEEAGRLVFPQAGLEPAHPDDAVAACEHRGDVEPVRGRGAAAREQPHQEPGAALQHPVPRRQVLSIPERHRARVPAPRIPPRRERTAEPLLRPVSARLCGAREHSAPAPRAPPPRL